VLFASSREPVHTIVVTSSGPKEGKTTVATNLAVALAQTGQRVLLIDADMRRPSVHKALGAEQEPGLSEVTTGRAQVESAMRESSVTGLWLLAAGAVPNNPAELLSSPQLKQLLERLGQQFAWIIIDSPPVMAVADASLIANVAGAVLFVVAAERTQTPVAINALDQLDAARARFIGAVLNQVDLQHNAFFYSSYYRPEYGAYYISES
jgi:capsular exopolysaccharide synthesis family protein